MMRTVLFACIVTAVLSPLAAAQQCYFPNGDPDPHGKVCNPTNVNNGGHSSCCYKGDICHADGTCATKIWNDNYRQSCTDPSWENTACPRDICYGNSTEHPEFPQRGIEIIKCIPKDRQACCKGSEDNCCDSGELFTYRPGEITTILDEEGDPMYTNSSSSYSSESSDLKSEVIGLSVALGMVFLTGSGTIAFLWWKLHREWKRRLWVEEKAAKKTSAAAAMTDAPRKSKNSSNSHRKSSSSQVSAMSNSSRGGSARTLSTEDRHGQAKDPGSDARFNSVASLPSAELRYPPSTAYNTISSMHTQQYHHQPQSEQQYPHYQHYQPHAVQAQASLQQPQIVAMSQYAEPQAQAQAQEHQNLPQQLGYYATGQDANELVATERATELGVDERAMELEIRPERFSFTHTPH